MTINIGLIAALNIPNIKEVNIITDSIHTIHKIFKTQKHLLQSITKDVIKELSTFFQKSTSHKVHFWACLEKAKWSKHVQVDHDSKEVGNTCPVFSSKQSFLFYRKHKCDNLLVFWKMHFSASDKVGNSFLYLKDKKGYHIELSYQKGRPWLKYMDHNNFLYTIMLDNEFLAK